MAEGELDINMPGTEVLLKITELEALMDQNHWDVEQVIAYAYKQVEHAPFSDQSIVSDAADFLRAQGYHNQRN